MDKASGDPLNPSSPPVKVTETCRQCYGIAYMTAYMIANDLEPGCMGLKSTLKRGSQLEVLNPEARSEPIDTIVIGKKILLSNQFSLVTTRFSIFSDHNNSTFGIIFKVTQ